jgi:glucose-1-phosphate cytidylyltransferase
MPDINLSAYQAVILCGGQGTRIRGVADGIPKPLIDVGGKPILWHIMKTYSFYGIRKFILCLGYKGEAIIDYFENYHSRNHDFIMTVKDPGKRKFAVHTGNDRDVDDWQITFALTGEHTMTGGRIKRIRNYIDQDHFFATYGDGVSDVDLRRLFSFHRDQGKTAILTGVHLPTTFGIVETDDNGRITSFREKPVLPGRINGGYFVFDRKIFDHIDDDTTVLEDLPFKRLVRSGEIAMFTWDGFWHCMDTYKDHQELNKMWNEGKAPWKLWT